jgi:DNA primase
MDDLKLLKKRIYDDEKVEQLLLELGCHHIKPEQGGNLITAALPNGDNKRSIQVKNNEHLNVAIRSKGIDGIDIYGLVGYILYGCETFDEIRAHLFQIKTYICNVLDYPYTYTEKPKQEKKDWNAWLKAIKRKRQKTYEITENKVLDERILDQYFIFPNIWWLQEGIDIVTQREFEVGFDIESERIVFPIRNKDGKLISLKGRYIGKDQETLENKKYMYLINFSKSIELFNLHRASPYIREKKECIIVEGAKTVMKLHGWGYKNCVSIEGDSLSPVQVKLLKELGLDVKLVFAWDKDKNVEFIKKQLKQIKNREIYVVYDIKNLLKEKDSPTDRGKKVWDYLYKNKFEFQ